MKRIFIVAVLTLVVGLLAITGISCKTGSGIEDTIGIEISCDEFASEKHITKEIEVTYPGEIRDLVLQPDDRIPVVRERRH